MSVWPYWKPYGVKANEKSHNKYYISAKIAGMQSFANWLTYSQPLKTGVGNFSKNDIAQRGTTSGGGYLKT